MILGEFRLESNLVSDGSTTTSFAPLLSYALCYADGGDTSRLGTDDVALCTFATVDPLVQDKLWYLRGLSGTSRGHTYGDIVLIDVLQ